MVNFSTNYISAGGNRHPSAADWDPESGLLAFGADRNIALWSPCDTSYRGIRTLLRGHTDIVNVLQFFPSKTGHSPLLLSGSVDQSIHLWQIDLDSFSGVEIAVIHGHTGSVNCLAVAQDTNIIATGASDASVRLWRLTPSIPDSGIAHLQTLQLAPKYFPLALALCVVNSSGDILLAVAGTKSSIQIYAGSSTGSCTLQTTLIGHEGWVRSLAFSPIRSGATDDLLLASASQDKYIRLWRIATASSKLEDDQSDIFSSTERALSNKVYRLTCPTQNYSVTFEALLLGHDDWIYTVCWSLNAGKLRLLSASEDSSLAIWEQDAENEIWTTIARLGEISGMKGSTTATGSAGGFWIGLWSPSGDSVLSLGRTGSWRLWRFNDSEQRWVQEIASTGHVKIITDVAWSRDGSYLLTTSADQTTRLHAEWKRGTNSTWHEFSRPQIHGYDLNCIDTIDEKQFVSGADEKLLRVFDLPRATADLLGGISVLIPSGRDEPLPNAADIPVLGLSNKAMETSTHADNSTVQNEDSAMDIDQTNQASFHTTATASHTNPSPPTEDSLGRHTLWPEREKLYGHGHEISAIASTHKGDLIATSCKASSQDHALIRLYTTQDWREVKPPLMAHSLTVTALRFSANDEILLSVGRDRQWVVWERTKADESHSGEAASANYGMSRSNPKGHSRMILNACWLAAATSPSSGESSAAPRFATAGRDKCVKIWSHGQETTDCVATITMDSAVTAVDAAPRLIEGAAILAIGLETGVVELCFLSVEDWKLSKREELPVSLQPTRAITQLAWRPSPNRKSKNSHDSEQNDVSDAGKKEGSELAERLQLAVSSEDSSLRLFTVTI